MKIDRRLVVAMAMIGAATLVWLFMTIGLIAFSLETAQRSLIASQVLPWLAWIGLTWVLGLLAIGATLRWLFYRYATAPARLLEQTRVLLAAPRAAPMNHHGTQETQALAAAIFQLAQQRDQLREDVATQISQASQGIAQEKSRLAALMAELTQSVVVCNLDGQILLYNNRARLQFKALSRSPAGGAELIGIGRSIYSVFERQLVAHALESIEQRLLRGAASPSAQFVTTTQAGQLLRVQMAPVRMGEDQAAEQPLSGFVLMLDNVTRAYEEETRRDQVQHDLAQACRVELADMRSSLSRLDQSADTPQQRLVARQTLHDQVSSLEQRMAELDRQAGLKTRWPLEDMLGSDVLQLAQQRIQKLCGRSVTLDSSDNAVWLRVDSFSLMQVLQYLSARLVEEFDVRFLRLRLFAENGSAKLDLIWSGQVMSTETVMSWEMDGMQFGNHSLSLSVRDV